MEPQEIDKLFGERLKKAAPTPPADLWNRLQQRIDTEIPAPQPEVIPIAAAPKDEKRIMLWVHSYGIAATLALLLCAGILFYNLRTEQPASKQLAQQDVSRTEKPETKPAPALAAGEMPATGVTTEETTPETPDFSTAPATTPAAPARTVAKAPARPAGSKATAPAGMPQMATVRPVPTLASSTPTVEPTAMPAAAEPAPAAPVALAATQPVQPVEIIIKRSSAQQVADNHAADEAEEELSGFEKKHRLAKGIFRQARNLSNGERIDLADLGINANKIAFETQIGKQKISKVINL